MIQPIEMTTTRPMELHDGVVSTTTDVWDMLVASRNGDLGRVQELAQRCPALLACQYDYTTPLHFAVREGHLDLVRYLVQHRALDPTYLTHPFRDSLVTMAEDRGEVEIAQLLRQSLDDPQLTRAWGDTGRGVPMAVGPPRRLVETTVGRDHGLGGDRRRSVESCLDLLAPEDLLLDHGLGGIGNEGDRHGALNPIVVDALEEALLRRLNAVNSAVGL
jgi:ankyrin repeat protein